MSEASIIHITETSPLSPVIDSWKVYLQDQGKSKYTVKSFVGDLELFAKYLPVDQPIGQISSDTLSAFLAWLEKGRGVPCSPKSYARRVTSLKSFFRWLSANGRIVENPAEKIVQRTVLSPLPQILTVAEQEKVYAEAKNYRSLVHPDARPYLLLSLLVSTGIKKGECLAIHLNHLDIADPDHASIFIRYANPANRFKERKIPLNASWVEAFKEYTSQFAPDELLFPWSPRRLEYMLEDLGKKAQLTKHLSFDMCRWTCAVNDWMSFADKDAIRQKLGVSKMQWREISSKISKLAIQVD